MRNHSQPNERAWVILIFAMGTFSLGSVATYHNLSDGDLWAKLSLGASLWIKGFLPGEDFFAFTPVLPVYRDHEWGSGAVFFAILKVLGGPGLMLLKFLLYAGGLFTALHVAKRTTQKWSFPLLLAVPAALCILPGYVPVIRSHALTYFFFVLTIWALEMLWDGRKSAVLFLWMVMLVWANCHGGFVAGLGTIGVFAASSLFLNRKQFPYFLAATLGSAIVTLVNPYGFELWKYLIPALLHPRREISEWQPLTLWEWDSFIGFRIFFGLVVLSLLLGWKSIRREWTPRLAMICITAFLAWQSRRHAPFFGIAALSFSIPFFEASWIQIKSWIKASPPQKTIPLSWVAILYFFVTLGVSMRYLPQSSWQVLAPVGSYPVREADILSLAQVKGNVAVPFHWGSYVSWRLYPKIHVSIDGRYEAVYPESTFQMNQAFFNRGADWDQLLRNYSVDFIILDQRSSRVQMADLQSRGFDLIWENPGQSALLSKSEHAPRLRETVRDLPPTTIDPLDATIPAQWWPESLGP